MSRDAKRFLVALWVGVAVQVGGRILDGIWHANHDEFEAVSQQLEAHWLLWLGVLLTLAVAALAVIRLPAGDRNAGHSLVLAGGVLYVPISIWHFIEHANLNDPELAHYLLALGQLAILVGAVVAAILSLRRPVSAA
jgi:hypothetical protein